MVDNIKSYWDKQATDHGGSHCASWGDSWMIELEIDLIGSFIPKNASILDVGCANGYSAVRQMESRQLKLVVGVDFSENMISEANRLKARNGLGENISFEIGDVRNLRFDTSSFDVVYTTRVLINLPSWEEQKAGIDECIRVAKSGGTVIFSEGFWEPLVLLNAMRALKQLPPLVEHDFNRYLKMDRVRKYLDSKNLNFHIEDFSSIYYLGSRFLRDLVTKVDDYPEYSNPINKIFFEIEREYSGGGFGIQQAIVINKA
jgi:ubiquinone/menaquinone biosynthesis C-methylase UbiE